MHKPDPFYSILIHSNPFRQIFIAFEFILTHSNQRQAILIHVDSRTARRDPAIARSDRAVATISAQLPRKAWSWEENIDIAKKTLQLPRTSQKTYFCYQTWNQTLEIENLTFGKSNIGDNNSKFGNRKLWNRNLEIGKLKSENWYQILNSKIENEFLKTKFGNRKLENRNRTSLGATRHSSSFGAHHSVVALILESLLRSRSWALRYSPLKRENVRIPNHEMSVLGPAAYDTRHWHQKKAWIPSHGTSAMGNNSYLF